MECMKISSYNGHTSTATRLSSWHNVYSVQFFALISVLWVIFLHEPPFVRYLGKTGKNHDFALTLRSILDMKEWQQDKMSYIFKISIKCSIEWHFKNFKNFIPSLSNLKGNFTVLHEFFKNRRNYIFKIFKMSSYWTIYGDFKNITHFILLSLLHIQNWPQS